MHPKNFSFNLYKNIKNQNETNSFQNKRALNEK